MKNKKHNLRKVYRIYSNNKIGKISKLHQQISQMLRRRNLQKDTYTWESLYSKWNFTNKLAEPFKNQVKSNQMMLSCSITSLFHTSRMKNIIQRSNISNFVPKLMRSTLMLITIQLLYIICISIKTKQSLSAIQLSKIYLRVKTITAIDIGHLPFIRKVISLKQLKK